TIDPEIARLASSWSARLSIAERISGSRLDHLDRSPGLGAPLISCSVVYHPRRLPLPHDGFLPGRDAGFWCVRSLNLPRKDDASETADLPNLFRMWSAAASVTATANPFCLCRFVRTCSQGPWPDS